MEVVVVKMLFILSVSAQFREHVYVKERLTWREAQRHCRHNYIDLSSITTPRAEEILKNATIGKVNGEFWIGLHSEGTTWKWSGGGNATNIPWSPKQPDGTVGACMVCWHNCQWGGWHDFPLGAQLPFLCFNLIVVKQKKTWEKALRHCTNEHTSLTSLASETEQLLVLRKIKHVDFTERVWIGLRYLGDGWMWVNGDPLWYKVWPKGGDQDHLCPIRRRCGALTKQGLWENRDCQEQLNFICY